MHVCIPRVAQIYSPVPGSEDNQIHIGVLGPLSVTRRIFNVPYVTLEKMTPRITCKATLLDLPNSIQR